MEKDQKIIRTLVVEDMPFMQRAIKKALQSDPCIEVVGTAKDGKDALRALERLKPDVITMDVEMPEMDGITAIKHIMVRNPRPVVMISGMAKSSRTTLEALSLGAVDFVPKPGGSSYRTRSSSLNELCTIIKEVAAIDPKKIRRAKFPNRQGVHRSPLRRPAGLVIILTQRGTMSSVMRLLAMLEDLQGSSLLVISELEEVVLKSMLEGLRGHVMFELKSMDSEVAISAGACAMIPYKCEFTLYRNRNRVPILRRVDIFAARKHIRDLVSYFGEYVRFIVFGNKLDHTISSMFRDCKQSVVIFDPYERPLTIEENEVLNRVIDSEYELQIILHKWFHKFSKKRWS